MPLAAITTRVVALWILFGAVLKLLYGSPADLPQAVKDLPLDIGTTFTAAIAIELALGCFALLRPSRGWLPLLLVLVAFLVVLGTQIAAGDESCGCFGAALVIAPV
ncbi:MAG: hypothetical protein QNJ90_02075, partial [Planctomycetota bacterium]|nr:hypothetical protein [Planctomycetota bacterium]